MPAPGWTTVTVKDDLAKLIDKYLTRNKEGLTSRTDVVNAAVRIYLGVTRDPAAATSNPALVADQVFGWLSQLQATMAPNASAREVIDAWLQLVQPQSQKATCPSCGAKVDVQAVGANRYRSVPHLTNCSFAGQEHPWFAVQTSGEDAPTRIQAARRR